MHGTMCLSTVPVKRNPTMDSRVIELIWQNLELLCVAVGGKTSR